MYADDTQLYASCRPQDCNVIRIRLSNCVADVALWCASRRFQLNAEKTEAIWFGLHENLQKLASYDYSLRVESNTIQPSTFVRDLRVYLDAKLTMKQHVSKVAAACFYHLCRLRQILRRVGTEVTVRLVLFACTHHLQTGLLQLSVSWRATVHSQRTAACPERCSSANFQSRAARPRQRQSELHWLPIDWRIQYKLNVLMHGIITGKCPDYLRTTVQPVTSSHPGLRSAACPAPKFVTPRLRTKFGERAFSYTGPAVWNSLPIDIRCTTETQTFKKLLKSYLFSPSF